MQDATPFLEAEQKEEMVHTNPFKTIFKYGKTMEIDIRKYSLCAKRLFSNSILPHRNRVSDAGFDIHAYMEGATILSYQPYGSMCFYSIAAGVLTLTIPPGERAVIPTGISVSCPPANVLQVWPRSGWAVKNGLDVLAGLIDSGYRGEVMVVLQNHGKHNVEITHQDRIAQLVPVQLITLPMENGVPLLQFHEIDSHTNTSRGELGFGSSGFI